MHHRYGRHGPRAWLRWRERRFHRYSPCFDDTVYTVVVYVPLPPVNIGRIVFIMTIEEQNYHSNEVVPSTNEAVGYSRPEEEQNSFSALLWDAQRAGRRKAQRDRSNGGGYSSGKQLRIDALNSEEEYTESNELTAQTANGKMPNDIASIYIQGFIVGYEGYLKQVGDQGLPDEATGEVQEEARADKEIDISHKKLLSDNHITYQAVIRARKQLKLGTHDIDYFEVEKFVKVYEDVYSKYTPMYKREVDPDQNQSGSFRR